MRKGMLGCVMVLCCGVIFASGCAKEELVKKDEPVAAPAVPAPAPKPAQPAAPREEVVPTQTVKEAPISVTEETSQATAPVSALDKIYFDFDSFTLSQAARDTLAKNAEILLKKLSGKVQIEGHCDERGSDEYNLALGEKRAKSAMNYLVTLGVPAERLSVISYGKEKPAEPGHDEAAWAKNRRGEFVIIK
ncbi:MAG TPA: peptidoglycan-associated lipoprotein Pal [Geomobilimonas sp.]|nr:peptidoglycan-associated lipoprotein Pal [Geomobilimonas sp.]